MNKLLYRVIAIITLYTCGLRAQTDSLGIDTSFFSYSVPGTTTINSVDNYYFAIKHYGNSAYTGDVEIYIEVDSSNTGNSLVLLAYDSLGISLPSGGTYPDSVSVPITGAFRQGINTVVIWPKTSAANPNAFITHDSLKVMVLATGFAGIATPAEGAETIIFPNPFTEKLYVMNRESNVRIERVRILNSEGKEISNELFKGYINVQHFQPGAYILEFIDSTGKVKRYKAIKE
ncbi:MAG: T9SS type A sorting domain-containing protein [Bacteroidia bacterium]